MLEHDEKKKFDSMSDNEMQCFIYDTYHIEKEDRPFKDKFFGLMYWLLLIFTAIICIISLLSGCGEAYAENWVATAYCSCVKCCGKSDGITASGVKAHTGTVACNWLPFGTLLFVEGQGFCVVEDRGSTKYFGTKKEKRKRLDIWFPTHDEAVKYGRKSVEVEVLN